MNSHSHKSSANDSVLTSVAESIGATLGTIAAKADAAKKALVRQTNSPKKGRSAASRNSPARKRSPKKAQGARRAAARTTSRRRRTRAKGSRNSR